MGDGFAELVETQGAHLGLVVPGRARLDPARAVALFAVGACDEYGADPFVRAAGEQPTGSQYFIVGVGVNGHQRQFRIHGLQDA
ncbi:hypothetical protein GCM10009780_45630 [Actinomadura alba]